MSSRELDKINKDIINLIKQTKSIDEKSDKHNKEFSEIKKILKRIEQKVNEVSNKVQEFEIILDTAEALEEHLEEKEEQEGYDTEWNPYEDEDYNSEGYEEGDNYDDNY